MSPEINGIPQISVQEVQDRMQRTESVLVDVREIHEHERATIKSAQTKPLSSLADTYSDLPHDKDILVLCRVGGRSQQAAEFLKAHGYKHVFNITGGINAWAENIDTRLSPY